MYEQNSPQVVKTQFIVFITISICMLTQVYMYAWPADYMKEWVNNIKLMNLYLQVQKGTLLQNI